MPLHIRPLDLSDVELVALARVFADAAPPLFDFEADHLAPASMRRFHAGFGAAISQLHHYVAVDDTGEIVGSAQCFPTLWLPEPGSFWLMVRVRQDWQGRGVGRQLYARVRAGATQRGATTLFIQTHERTPAFAALIEREGFTEAFRSWELALDPHGCDETLWARHTDRAASQGITFTTLADEQACGGDWLARVYDLHTSFIRDIPLPDHPNPAPPIPWFAHAISAAPEALPDGFFIAKRGDEYLGESFAQRDPDDPGVLHHKITGVRADGRGRGVALALKLLTIRYAQQHGYTSISTWNESTNPRMLLINQKLGFVQGSGTIIFTQSLLHKKAIADAGAMR